MLKLFKAGNCGRGLYLCLFAFLLAFDVAKGPMETYLAKAAETVKNDIYTADGLKLRGMHDATIGNFESTSPKGRAAATAKEVEAGVSEMVTAALAMEAKSSAVGAAYISALAALGLITIVGMIWMVFARVRDIGWPTLAAFGLLSPALLLRLFGAEMTDMIYYAMQYGFLIVLFVLGLIPSGFGNSDGSQLPLTVQAPARQRLPGQFGRSR